MNFYILRQYGFSLSLILAALSAFADAPIEPCGALKRLTTPQNSTQMIVVTPAHGIHALVTLCQKHQGHWRQQFASMEAVVGKQGIAKSGEKREGDLKTPSGVFPIGTAFGTRPLRVKMDYRYITRFDKFIDDSASPDYNRWITGPTTAKSYESMLIPDYTYGMVIGYNMAPTVAGLGSAIFIHIWRSTRIGTSGCIALDKNHLLKILNWLDKNQHPYVSISVSPQHVILKTA